MRSLLKADLRRVLKDKLLIVMGILAVVFALITPLLYALIISGMGADEDLEIFGIAFTAKSMFFNSFSLGNNLGLIVPVLLAIVLCKDFSFGTVRNKIIAGKTRFQIYMSLFITCSVVFILCMLLHAFITLCLSLCFFDYQLTPFTASDFWYFLESFFLEILVLLFVSSMLSWLCASRKNVGLAIVLYVAITFALIMIGSILQVAISLLEAIGGKEDVVSVLTFINRINVFNATAYIGIGDKYSLTDVLYIMGPALSGIIGFLGLGILKFKKKDLK